jgi:two-component system sensor histidine kinase ChiS
MVSMPLGRIWLASIWLCAWFASTAVAQDFSVRFESVKTRAGVTLGYIDAILQDSTGFIWMGGENGLVRYDGYQFRNYRNHPDDPSSLSNNTIWALAEDARGDLWIATEGGVNRYNREKDNFTRFHHDPNNAHTLSHDTVRAVEVTRTGLILTGTFGGGAGLLHPEKGSFIPLRRTGDQRDSHVWAVYEDMAGRFWVGTEGSGASSFDPQSRALIRYHTQASEGQRIGSDTVRAITQDRAGDMWLGTDAGVYRIVNGVVSEHWRHIPGQMASLGSNIVWDIHEDRNGDIWVATDGGGLNLVRRNTPLVRRFVHNSLDTSSISSNVVRRVMEDQAGDIWTGNFPSGVNVFHRASQWVTNIRHDQDGPGGLNSPSVLSLLETEDGTVWIGTDGGGVNRLRPDGNFEYLVQDGAAGLSANAVLALAQDRQGEIWIGTWGGGVNRYNPATGDIKHYPFLQEGERTLSHPNIWAILVDQDGDVWFGTEGGGLNRYNREEDSFERIPYGKADSRHTVGSIIWSLFQDHWGKIWIGSNAGLSRLDKASGEFRHWQHIEGDPLSLSNNTVLAIFEDRQQQLWVGTRAGLNRMHPNGDTFHTLRTDDGLASDAVTSILQDADGLLWLGTADGLASVDPATYAVRNYNQADWARGKFNYGSALKLQSGELAFGSIHGFVRFLPQNLQPNTFKPPVVLTDFQIFNQSVVPGADGSALPKALGATRHIVLDHRQSVFSFEFAALNYYGTESNRYAYKLEGFDRHWNDIGTQRKATYTNLGAGEYFLRVKAANNDGVWNDEGLEVRLTITPAPWRTWWAYLLYTLVAALLVRHYIRVQKRKIAQERAVNERLLQLDKLKDDFLANTSHELRTPLNGIIGLAESLLDGVAGDLSPQIRLNLQMISDSGRRLSSLVNDILDFARLKNHRLLLELKPVKLRALVDTVLILSRPLAGRKDLDLSNQVDAHLPAVLADENRLQQILYNLVGNAIKFTDRGSVVVAARRERDLLWISVSDTGIGIAEENFDKIFAAFEQLEGHSGRQHGGTGLGLAVVRQLVELQGGEIQVSSEPGSGTTFSFSLKCTDELPAASSPRNPLLDLDPSSVMDYGDNQEKSGSFPNLEQVQENSRFRLLLVDDEATNRQVLCNHLSLQGYQLVEAESGPQALEFLHLHGPFDLVLLDIMMPRMSGYEVCARIRKEFPVNELPVIFLSAKNLIADLMDGFEVGANDFLTKPIAKGELVSRVRTHLQLLDVHRHLEEKVKERTQEVEQANKVLETLDGIVATINQEVILERLLDVLLREALHLFSAAERAIYWSLNSQTGDFEAVAAAGYPPSLLPALTLDRNTLVTRYCSHGQRLDRDIHLLKPNTLDRMPMLPGLPMARAELALAISFDDGIIGLLSLHNLTTQDAFDHLDKVTIGRFHSHIRSALLKARLMEALKAQNERLEDASLNDTLTGLRNRRYLLKYMDSDVALTLRSHRSRAAEEPPPPNSDLLFFMLEIDRLAEINDTYGKAAGDRVLVQIKHIMAQVFRESDFLVRWSGDEFLMVARFSNRKAAPLMVERLHQAVSQYAFDLGNGQTLRRTCSIGFASFPYLISDPLAFSWNQVVDIASQCLYAAKRSQRDGWVGLEANIASEGQLTHQAITTRPQQLISERKLLLHTSITPDKPLHW